MGSQSRKGSLKRTKSAGSKPAMTPSTKSTLPSASTLESSVRTVPAGASGGVSGSLPSSTPSTLAGAMLSQNPIYRTQMLERVASASINSSAAAEADRGHGGALVMSKGKKQKARKEAAPAPKGHPAPLRVLGAMCSVPRSPRKGDPKGGKGENGSNPLARRSWFYRTGPSNFEPVSAEDSAALEAALMRGDNPTFVTMRGVVQILRWAEVRPNVVKVFIQERNNLHAAEVELVYLSDDSAP